MCIRDGLKTKLVWIYDRPVPPKRNHWGGPARDRPGFGCWLIRRGSVSLKKGARSFTVGAGRWLSPIRKCVLYAEAISAGHEDAKLDVYRTDCLGHLAESLRIMVAKLEDQAHWYESILNTLPLSISVTDNDMVWTFCNTNALGSRQKTCQSDVVGKHCSEKQGNI